jgi:uncharacterized membrane protein YeaQ/YmgE (transglycosylase-associated protein family)
MLIDIQPDATARRTLAAVRLATNRLKAVKNEIWCSSELDASRSRRVRTLVFERNASYSGKKAASTLPGFCHLGSARRRGSPNSQALARAYKTTTSFTSSGTIASRGLSTRRFPAHSAVRLIKINNFNRDLIGRLPNKSYDTKLAFGVTLNEVLKANEERKSMVHLIWYILIGLISGVIAKSVMHVHLTTFWTIVLGIIGSILGGAVTHVFSRPKNERYHPAGLIFSTLGAILVLYICYKLKIHFPQV